jgi:hypothetical protein
MSVNPSTRYGRRESEPADFVNGLVDADRCRLNAWTRAAGLVDHLYRCGTH